MDRFVGKVVVLAGGGGGIGGATARRLASEGARVVIGDLDAEDAGRIAQEINDAGGTALATLVDVGDDDSVRQLVELAVSTYGGLDGLHFNAAQRSLLPFDSTVVDIDLGHWDEILRVTLKGGVHCARHAVPALVERGGGALVFTSSVAAYYGEPVRVAYAAAKSGLHAVARHVADAWGKQGVRANCIAPGTIVTPHNLKAVSEEDRQKRLLGARSRRLGVAEDIAGTVAHLMSDDGAFIQGQVISVDGGAFFRA